jgi:hypothetical protein
VIPVRRRAGLAGFVRAALSYSLLVSTSSPARAEPSTAAGSDDEATGAGPDEEEAMPPPGYLPGHNDRIGLGLSPHAPGQQSVLPGGVTPAFGAPLRPAAGAKFDFHGYVQAGSRASIGKRNNPTADQSSFTLHGDPIVPRGNVFENTNTVPYTWAELRFNYSTPSVTGTVSLGAWSLAESMQAAGSFIPNAEVWIRDAFLTYVPRGLDPFKLSWNVGVYEDRYGAMAQYDNGRYGAPLIATIAGVGETLSARVPLGGRLELALEHGLKSSFSRPPVGIATGPSNNWPKPWEGQTFVNHAHVGLDIAGVVQPTLHWISAFARDDQADSADLGSLRAGYQTSTTTGVLVDYPALSHADGSLTIVGADARFNLRRYGFLVVGVSKATANHIRTVSGVVQIQNAGGGRDLMDRYFGRNNDQGHGSLLLVGAEYSVSLGELMRLPDEFWGEGPDLRLSLFGLYGQISADDPARDGEKKYKFGIEATYSTLPWLALSGRFDRATPYVDPTSVPLYPNQNDNSYSVVTLKTIFRSDWLAREALTLQYSRYFYRSQFHLVSLNAGGQISQVSDRPDEHLIALYANLWW